MTLHNKQEAFASALVRESGVLSLPRKEMPHDGTGGQVAYDLLTNELLLDGSARLNLATFVTTWMPPHAAPDGGHRRQEHDRQGRVPADRGVRAALREHPRPTSGTRPAHGDVTGTFDHRARARPRCSAGMALKWRWRERMKRGGQADRPAEPRDGRERPGLLGQVLPLLGRRAAARADGGRALPPRPPTRPSPHCDENTIGVVAILGSTFDGSYEPVEEICAALDALAADGGPDVPVHVDGASGGFVAPFVQPDLVWDFQLAARARRSTPPATSTASSTRASAGRSGATPSAARRPRVQRQLPRRQHAHVRAELLAARAARSSRSTSCS